MSDTWGTFEAECYSCDPFGQVNEQLLARPERSTVEGLGKCERGKETDDVGVWPAKGGRNPTSPKASRPR